MANRWIDINRQHYNPAARPGILFRLLAWGYGLVVLLRLALYRVGLLRSHHLPVPVISIGNLTTGGTGKTPMVMGLAQYLENQGMKVAVLSRGYGAQRKTDFHQATHPQYGDEPFLIQQKLKQGRVYVGKNRFQVAQKMLAEFTPDVIILDDGFQHLPLARDINLLLVDGLRGFGNEHLLPAGPLREPLSQMMRAHRIILTKQPTVPVQERIKALGKQNQCDTIPVTLSPFEYRLLSPATQTILEPAVLQDLSVLLVSGIAQPEDLERQVRSKTQCLAMTHRVFPDHMVYTSAEMQPLLSQLEAQDALYLVTTEKDWVKLASWIPEGLRKRVYLFIQEPQFPWELILDTLKIQQPDGDSGRVR